MIAQDEALLAQMTMITGDEPRGAFLELRYRTPGGMRQTFVACGQAELAAETARRFGQDTDLYVGAAPRRARRGRAQDIDRTWVAWVDADTAEAVEQLEAFELRPTMVVQSGGLDGDTPKVHVWWALNEPVPVDQVSRMNLRLAHHLGADTASTDPARVMRSVGTWNYKSDPPRPVVCTVLDDRRYHPRQLVGNLPDPPAQLRADVARAHHRHVRADDPLLAVPADEYVPRLTGRELQGRYVQCPFHGDGAERTPSLAVYDTTWTCFACPPQPGAGRNNLGGSIYTMAALLGGFPMPLRGGDFLRVRMVLRGHFRTEAAA